MRWFPYIKQTQEWHSSGYLMFEVGYVNDDGKKITLGACCDHVNVDNLSVNLDILDDGSIRFHNHNEGVRWFTDKLCYSSMVLIQGWFNEK